MEVKLYCNIVNDINNFKGLSRNCLKLLTENFPSVSHGTLCSILSLEYQKLMKYSYVKSQSNINKYNDLYMEAMQNGEPPGIIIRISEEANIAPCLIAKLILLKKCSNEAEENETSAQALTKVNKYIRDTSSIEDSFLAYEVYLCTLYDNQYSPSVDIMKSSIGQQYEIQLFKELSKLGIAFRDEDHLRKYGYDKTPDVKLEIPIAVDGFIIHWIESKALFGDNDVHKDYTKNQYSSYWNRFGPGLVIYWFGYVESINNTTDKRFIIRDHLPTKIIQIHHSDKTNHIS